MGSSNMVPAMLIFCSLALVNCNTELRETAGSEHALVATNSIGNHRTQIHTFDSAGKVVYRIGVTMRSNITWFLSIKTDAFKRKKHITGFSIDVFKAAARLLPWKIKYKLIPFDGSSDELIEKVANKDFDAAIGDFVTSVGHNQHVDFSHPYLKQGFTMVGKAKANELNLSFKLWMWAMIVALRIYLGTLIWIIERQYNDGPTFVEVILLQGPPFRSIAARILNTLWFFAISISIVLCAYTVAAKVEEHELSVLNCNSLIATNAAIGCDGKSQTILQLVRGLGFNRRNIRILASINDYEEALSSGSIKAAFISTPYAKVLLAKHCTDFIEIKATYHYSYDEGGFGFIFPKGSCLASDMSTAILDLEESGELLQIEQQMPDVFYCSRELYFEDLL